MPDRIVLAPSPESVAAARQWSARRTQRAGLDTMSETVALLVSEMVTNVVLHARTSCELSLRTCGPKVRVEVRDGNPALPEESKLADPLASSGRGMQLIRALSDACGADTLPDGGKVVWFQMSDPSRAVTDA